MSRRQGLRSGCGICGRWFESMGALTRHIRDDHPAIWQEDTSIGTDVTDLVDELRECHSDMKRSYTRAGIHRVDTVFSRAADALEQQARDIDDLETELREAGDTEVPDE